MVQHIIEVNTTGQIPCQDCTHLAHAARCTLAATDGRFVRQFNEDGLGATQHR